MELLKKNDRLQTDLNKIGFTQIDNRNWTSNGYVFTKIDWRNLKELDRIGEIQDEVWKFGASNAVPPNILAVIEETGGDLLTVFNSNGKQEAFTLTLATDNPNKLFLHMVAVIPEKQSTNVGRKLMLLEGALARSRGINEIQWTYDPLMGGNSQLYVGRLRANPYKYTINKYGIVKNKDAGEESRYKNVETDRFTVKWRVGSEIVWNSITDNLDPNEPASESPIWQGEDEPPDVFRFGVPYDFTTLSTDEMMDARMALRKVAVKTLDFDDISSRNYKEGTHEVTGFMKDLNKLVNYYIFTRKASLR